VSATDTQLEAVRTAIEPAVAALGCELYDVELLGAGAARTLRVTVTKPGGVDLDTITAVTQAVSPIVDDAADVRGSYLLEVSSPGIERALRRPEHFRGALGEEVSVKFHTDAGPRRVRGVLRDATDDTIAVDSEAGDRETISLASLTQARTVFEWGPRPRPGKGKPGRARAKERS
jgi:ribosome maturation factor RimP